MSNSPTPFISYYNELGFVPTRQGIPISQYEKVRHELYLRLGFPPSLFRGSRIVEFGPGSGENTEYLATLGPASLTLVDGASSALVMTRDRVSAREPELPLELVESRVEDFDRPESYDIAICEGLLPFQTAPGPLLQSVMNCLVPGGVAVITCADPVSILSESIRRIVAAQVVVGLDTSEALAKLMQFFSPDMDLLGGMTRRREDWVRDQLLHAWQGTTFSFGDAVSAARGTARPLSSTPPLTSDWRWFKETASAPDALVDYQVRYYRSIVHNLLDCRIPADLRGHENDPLIEAAEEVFTASLSPAEVDLDRLLVLLSDVAQLPQTHSLTREALGAAVDFFETRREGSLDPFRGWWGRGQQYVALYKL